MKTQNQEKTWDKIAEKWAIYRARSTELIEKFLKNKKGKVLDLGCGSGRNFIDNKKIKYYGLDFSKKMLEKAREKIQKEGLDCELKKAKAHRIPYTNNFFDAAIYIATLHCLKSKRQRIKSLKEIQRVLKPNARAFISVWSRNQERIKNKPKNSTVPWTIEGKKVYRFNYIYDVDELLEEINSVGLKFVKIWEDKNINVIVKKPKS